VLIADNVFRKSTRSDDGVECVEVAYDGETIKVRDSKNPAGAVLTFNRGEWDAFCGGAADGEFNV